MSDPVLDEARLAAIQAAADAVKLTKWRTQASFKRNADAEFWVRGDLASAAAGHLVAAFLTEGLPALLAHVGVLRADNQRLREQIERLEALYRRSNARMDELVAQGQWLEAQGAVLHGLWKSEDGVASDGD